MKVRKIEFFAMTLSLYVIFSFALVSTSAELPTPPSANSEKKVNQTPLNIIISELANYKTFRLSSASIDSLINTYCRKNKEVKDENMIFSLYDCDRFSGVNSIKLDSRENSAERNYLMSLTINFTVGSYDSIKKIVENNLGRPTKSDKTSETWQYSSDRNLMEHGNPVIYITRNDAKNKASFHLALEQGP